MATIPSAFFEEYVQCEGAIDYVLGNVPPGHVWDTITDSQNGMPEVVPGTSGNDIFLTEQGDHAVGGDGYDAVAQSASGFFNTLFVDQTVEAGILDGNYWFGLLVGNGLDNNLIGGDGWDLLIGGGGNDVMDGEGGWDLLLGNDGDDALFGCDGKDTLLGGKGADTIFGGNQSDLLSGGKDHDEDVFGFKLGEDGKDTIIDFDACEDKIDLTEFGTEFSELKITDVKGGVIIEVGEGSDAVKFKLLGYSEDEVDETFFMF